MPRAKVGITTDNLFLVQRYFERAIKDNRVWNTASDSPEHIHQAIQEFKLIFSNNITEENYTNEEINQAIPVLQTWITQYIPPNKWQRCLKTLRQRKSRKRLRLHHLDLNHDVYICIRELADKFDLSLAEAIYKVAKVELDKIHQHEYAEDSTVQS